MVACHVPEPIVPTDVSDDETTVEFNTVPDRVPAGAITTLPEAAVISPLPLTVNDGDDEPKVYTKTTLWPTFKQQLAHTHTHIHINRGGMQSSL